MKTNPDFSIEKECSAQIIVGCDEAGRGPLCGPVVAAAVIFPNYDIEIPVIIRDSKQLSPRMRATAFEWIVQNTKWATGISTPAEIDEINILMASMQAMERAVYALNVTDGAPFCLVDGNRMPQGLNGRTVVRGDAKSLSIAAASIIAKETRDKIMRDLACRFPQYGWDKNSGYPTKSHLQAIDKYGINEYYRKSFGPIKQRIKDETAHD